MSVKAVTDQETEMDHVKKRKSRTRRRPLNIGGDSHVHFGRPRKRHHNDNNITYNKKPRLHKTQAFLEPTKDYKKVHLNLDDDFVKKKGILSFLDEDDEEDLRKKRGCLGLCNFHDDDDDDGEYLNFDQLRKSDLWSKDTIGETMINSGYLKDGIRRIDCILVTKDDGDYHAEVIKAKYITTLLKYGLHIEIVPGVIDVHRDYLFLKLHAPLEVLDEFTYYFNLRDFFKSKHENLIRHTSGIYSDSLTFPHEKMWLKYFRQKAGKYSNVERSRLVKKMLHLAPFGDGHQDSGIHRLLEAGLFLDYYALHDGPFLLAHNQNRAAINLRQLLYYDWACLCNVFKEQPLHLVAEYFGHRVGVFFAFYQHYNFFLFFYAVFGLLIFVLEFFDVMDLQTINEVCNDNSTVVCPTCKNFEMCPFRKLKELCFTAKVISYLDTPYTFPFGIVSSIWALVFVINWRRREKYWQWIWGLSGTAREHDIRPDYRAKRRNFIRSKRTGIRMDQEWKKPYRIFITSILVFVAVCLILITLLALYFFKMWLSREMYEAFKDNSGYPTMLVHSMVNLIILVSCEKTFFKMTFILNKFENHKKEVTYERSLVVKLYSLLFAFTFLPVIYIAFFKGHAYTYPGDPRTWYSLKGIAMMSCSPFGCLDELWVQIGLPMIGKEVILIIYEAIVAYYRRTDYNQGIEITNNAPCWEREYRLISVEETTLIQYYKTMVTQFSFVTLFVSAFPLAPVIAFVANLFSTRQTANALLTSSRRPIKPTESSAGVGAWLDILSFLAYASAFSNALTIALTTKTIQRYLYLYTYENGMEGFLNYTLSVFDANDYLAIKGPNSPHDAYVKYNGFKPERYCVYPGMRNPPWEPAKYEISDTWWHCVFWQLLFIIIFEHFVLFIILILHYIFPETPDDINETLAQEKQIKRLYFTTRYKRDLYQV